MTSTGHATPQLRTARTVKLERGTPVRQQARGRTCAMPSCGTLLSRYNPSSTCTRHAGWKDEE
jgi:hypothetical protein